MIRKNTYCPETQWEVYSSGEGLWDSLADGERLKNKMTEAVSCDGNVVLDETDMYTRAQTILKNLRHWINLSSDSNIRHSYHALHIFALIRLQCSLQNTTAC